QFYFTSGVFDYTPSGLYIRGVRYHQFNYYAQDEWKLRPNLTFSLGLRWEWNRPATEANDLILRPDKPLDGSQGLVTFAQRDTFWDRQNANSLAPRIGIAWDPFAKGKSVIRGGYSVLYDVISTFQMVPVLGLVPGSSARCSVSIGSSGVPVPSANCSAPAGSGSTIAGGFPLSLPSPTVPPSNFTTPPITQASLAPPTGAIDPDLQNPTVHEWTLNVQHDLGKSVILQVGYLGKRGTHLFDAYDLNQVKLPSSFLSAFSVARNNLVIGCDADGTVAGSSTAPCAIAGGAVPTLLNQMLCRTATTANNFNCSNTNNSAVTGRLISNAAGSLADLIDTGTSFTGTVSNPNNTFDNMRTVTGQANFFRSNPQFDSIFYFDNSTDSYYHALQIQLRRQANNLGFGASYTFGKSIDNGSTDPVGATSGGAIGNASTSTTDIRNFRVDRGRSDFDRTHSFVGHVVYDLPFGRGQKYAADVPGWLNQLVGGWTGTSIVTITSGEPWSALSGQLTNSNIRGSRVDILQNPPTGVFHNVSGVVGPTVFPESVLQNLDQFFAIPAPGTNGNSGRNIFTGPSYWNVDLGVTKRFTITERINLQFRAEFFNAFNHANFDNPLTSTSGVTTVFNANDTDFQDPNPN
ncbi:MAG: TonB-dependent receptor domain-containing protein, partial [Candidatus Acidiferrales bacterium]